MADLLLSSGGEGRKRLGLQFLVPGQPHGVRHLKELCAESFSPEAGGARTVGSSPILCLKRFPVWGEATEKGVEETYFRLMGSGSSCGGTGRGGEGRNTPLVEGGDQTLCDGRGGIRLFKPDV